MTKELKDYIKKLENLLAIVNDRIDCHYKFGTGLENIRVPIKPQELYEE